MHPALYSITTRTTWFCPAKREHLNAEKGYRFVVKQKVKLECKSRPLHDRSVRPCACSDPVSRHRRYLCHRHQTAARPPTPQNLELTGLKKDRGYLLPRTHFLSSEAPSLHLVQSPFRGTVARVYAWAPTATSQYNYEGHERGLERTSAFPRDVHAFAASEKLKRLITGFISTCYLCPTTFRKQSTL